MKRNFDKEISNMILALSVTLAKEWGLTTVEVGKLDDKYHFFDITPDTLDIYNSSVAQEMIKCLSTVPQECKSCDFKENCLGGLRCLTYAVTKKMDKGDINCPFLLTQ